MRKKKHPEHVNHERWLISYADFITLLFAFFVVMFAVSQVDTNKVGRFTESFSKAVGIDVFPQSGKGLLPSFGPMLEPIGASSEEATAAEERGLTGLREALLRKSKHTEELKELEVIRFQRELILRLPMSVVFDSGDDAVKESAAKALRALADEIKSRPVDVRIEGHTDDRPIHTVRFRSNWDLSACRATAIIANLAALGIEPPRLSAVGYGEFHPIAPNDTPEGRAKNRRVDLVVKMTVNRPADGLQAFASLAGQGDAGEAKENDDLDAPASDGGAEANDEAATAPHETLEAGKSESSHGSPGHAPSGASGH